MEKITIRWAAGVTAGGLLISVGLVLGLWKWRVGDDSVDFGGGTRTVSLLTAQEESREKETPEKLPEPSKEITLSILHLQDRSLDEDEKRKLLRQLRVQGRSPTPLRSLDREGLDGYIEQLRDGFAAEEIAERPTLQNTIAAFQNARSYRGIERKKHWEGQFLESLFGNGDYRGNGDIADEMVGEDWLDLFDALGCRLSEAEEKAVQDVVFSTHLYVDRMQEEYFSVTEVPGVSVSEDGVSVSEDGVSVSEDNRLTRGLVWNLLYRDLGAYYFEFEANLRTALDDRNFAVMEKVLRSLGLRSKPG